MPQRRNSVGPPPAMTWAKASPIIVVAGVFDVVRMFFQMFWFFGPALAALACTGAVNSSLGTSVAEMAGKMVATGCTAVAGVAGFFGVELTAAFGTVMAMAVGFLGFLVLGMWLVMTNARMFTVNRSGTLWFIGSLGISEIPFIGTFPAFSVVLFMLYRRQIKVEATALKKWEEAQAKMRQLEREQQIAQTMQLREAQESVNEEIYAEIEPDEEIPERVPKAV